MAYIASGFFGGMGGCAMIGQTMINVKVPGARTRISPEFVYQFDDSGDPDRVVIDLSDSHVWDASTVAALDGIRAKYARLGKTVETVGLNEASAVRHDLLSGHLGGEH